MATARTNKQYFQVHWSGGCFNEGIAYPNNPGSIADYGTNWQMSHARDLLSKFDGEWVNVYDEFGNLLDKIGPELI